ncbi:MAG: NAD-dependent epimerase/dehydratase family protein [Planctomycetota bacterium]
MRKPVVLITGANGEMGHALIRSLSVAEQEILALDVRPLDDELAPLCVGSIVGDILDESLLQRLVSEYEIHAMFHLAALLSTRAEYTPATAHSVNVNGTLNLLQLAHEQAKWHGHRVRFIFPSSIAIYGVPTGLRPKPGHVREDEWNSPTTMYGCNKLYCEHLGRYYTDHYQQLARERAPSGVEFRSLRFPGLISAVTTPSGGTSDYAPEMLHAAAQGVRYECFVPAEEQIPFMAMPDAIRAILMLYRADPECLTRRVYNLQAFSLSAAEIRERVLESFPKAEIEFVVDPARAGIVASWPAGVDDTAARMDWGWRPEFDARRAFEEYLIPGIRRRYSI